MTFSGAPFETPTIDPNEDPKNVPHAHPVGMRVWPVALTGVLLVGLLPLAMSSTVGAVLSIGVALFFVALITFGLRGLGAGLNVAGMVAAPMTSVVVPGASAVTISDLLFVVGFILLLPTMFGQRLRVPWQFALGASVLFVVGFGTSLFNEVPIGSLSLMVRVFAATLVFPLLFVWWAPRGRTLFCLAAGYVVGVVLSLAYGIVSGPDPLTARYIGLSEQPTAFGYAGLLALALLPFIYAKLAPQHRWMVLLAGALCMYTIWISGSRASLLVAAVLAVIYPAMERSIKVTAGLTLGGIFLIANIDRILNEEGGNALSRLLGRAGAAGSNAEREKGLREGWEVFTHHPIFGAGFDFDIFLAHNIYVQVLAGMGVIGLIAFLFVLWSMVSPIFHGPRPYRLLAYPALAYVIAGPITPNLGSRYVGILLALAFVVTGMDFDEDDEGAMETRRSRRRAVPVETVS
ncbi:O-antigen ligase family protein [Aeromicrobium sp. NPDC092404]|uniref:O-antigen ligase family protein n=1 Tax=Aeromicrobium sp. NPDC092404 TaxID=3154976 RepID=UPI0034132110